MLTTLWTSKSGLNANQEKLDVISNNIANVNTTGYKKVNAGFKDLIKIIAKVVYKQQIKKLIWH